MSNEYRKKITKASLSEIFDISKERLAGLNLSLKEVAINSGSPEDLIAIFFDNSNNIVDNLSRIINFSGIDLLYRKSNIKKYKIESHARQKILIRRLVRPICSVNYNKATDELTNFRTKETLSDIEKQIIINEFYTYASSVYFGDEKK